MLFAAILWTTTPTLASGVEGFALGTLHNTISARHPDVAHLSADDLAALKQASEDTVLMLDVREPDEFAVGHIAGALRVSPGITPAEFRRRFGNQIQGRTVVVYCSVGARSSTLAERLGEAGAMAGAHAVYNLAGGVFNWHNQQRPLVDIGGTTKFVHPYSWTWSRFLTHRQWARYSTVDASNNDATDRQGVR